MREEAKELKKTSVPGKEGRYDSYLHNTMYQDVYHLAKANNAQLDALTGTDVDSDGNFIGLGDPTHLTKSVDAFVKQSLYFDYGAVNALVLKRKIRDIDPLNEVTANRFYEQIFDGMCFFFIPFARNTSSAVTLQLNDHEDFTNNVYPVFNMHGEDLAVGYLTPPNVYLCYFNKVLGTAGGWVVHLLTSIPGGSGGAGAGRQTLFTHDDVLVENKIVDADSYTYINLKSNVDAGYSEYPNYYEGLSVQFEMHIHNYGHTFLELDGGGNPDDPTKAILFSKNHENLTQQDIDNLYLSPKQSFAEGQWYIAVYVPAVKAANGAQTVEHYWKVHLATPGDHSLYAQNPSSPVIRNAINEEISPALPLYETQRNIAVHRDSPSFAATTGEGVKILRQLVIPFQTSYKYYDSRDDEDKFKLDTRAGSIFGDDPTKYFNGRDGGMLYQEIGNLRLNTATTKANGVTPSPGWRQVIRVDSINRPWVYFDYRFVFSRLYFYIPYKQPLSKQGSEIIFNINNESYGKVALNINEIYGVSQPTRLELFDLGSSTFPVFAMYKDYDFFHSTRRNSSVPEEYVMHPAEINIAYEISRNNITAAEKLIFDQWIEDYYDGKGFICCYIAKIEMYISTSIQYTNHRYSAYYSIVGSAYDKDTDSILQTNNTDINYSVLHVSPY